MQDQQASLQPWRWGMISRRRSQCTYLIEELTADREPHRHRALLLRHEGMARSGVEIQLEGRS